MLLPLQRTPVSEIPIFFFFFLPTTSFNPRSNRAKARKAMNVVKSQIYCLGKLQPSASALCSSQLPTANLRAWCSSPVGRAARLLRGRPRATPSTQLAAHLGEVPASQKLGVQSARRRRVGNAPGAHGPREGADSAAALRGPAWLTSSPTRPHLRSAALYLSGRQARPGLSAAAKAGSSPKVRVRALAPAPPVTWTARVT